MKLLLSDGEQELDSCPREALQGIDPVILIGVDAHPRKIAGIINSVSEDRDWQVYLLDGWLLGVEAVWAGWISSNGTIGNALLPNPEAGIKATAIYMPADLMKRFMQGYSEHELETLRGCRWTSAQGDLVRQDPRTLLCPAGPLLVDGRPRAVAAIKSTGALSESAMLAEALIWIAAYLQARGLPYDTPRKIIEVSTRLPEERSKINNALRRISSNNSSL